MAFRKEWFHFNLAKKRETLHGTYNRDILHTGYAKGERRFKKYFRRYAFA